MPNSSRVAFVQPAWICQRVEEFRALYWPTGDIPVCVDTIADVKLGLDVVPFVGLLDDFDLDGFLVSDRSAIYIDADTYERTGRYFAVRRRFTLAEELAHWYLHKDLYTSNTFADEHDFVRFQLELNPQDRQRLEWQAKLFAANLLVPTDELQARIDHEIDRMISERNHQFDPNEEAQVDLMSTRVSRYFEVSRPVIKRRGYELGCWTFWSAKNTAPQP